MSGRRRTVKRFDPSNLSLRKKIFGNLLIVVLLILATIAGVGLFIQEEESDAHVINLAGNQRMLLEKTMQLSYMVADGQDDKRDELLATAGQYDRTLTALQEGDPERDIPKAPETVQPQLQTIESEWDPFYAAVRTIANEPRSSEEFQNALASVSDRHETLAAETDETVHLYEEINERKVQSLTAFLGLMLFLSLTVIAGMAFFSTRNVIKPIVRLTEEANEIATADLDRQVTTVDTDDEVGSLTRSIREMKTQLVESIRETELFQRAVDEAGHAIYITKLDGTIEYVNPAFEDVLGYSEDEVIGNSSRILHQKEHEATFYEPLWETIERGETFENEVELTRKSGEQITVDQTIAPIVNEEGDVERLVAVTTDITERKRRKQVIEVLNRILRHNMRNDMNVITGRAELIRRDRMDTLGSRCRDIETTANELTQFRDPSDCAGSADAMSNELTETTVQLESLGERVRSDAVTVRETAEDLQELSEKAGKVQDVIQSRNRAHHGLELSVMLERELASFRESSPDSDISLDVPDEVSVTVSNHIQTAIHELLENAIVHNESDSPTVEVTVRKADGESLTITIADDGPGIPEQEREVLRQGKETPLLHGSGMGLWLVYWMISMAGGDLTIEDGDSGGTIVTLSLPEGFDSAQENSAGSVE